MNSWRLLQGLISVALVAALCPGLAEERGNESGRKEAPSTERQPSSQVYTPPPPANPKPLIKVTVGAPRGSNLDIQFSLLVPVDRVLAWNDPTLNWEISRDMDSPVRLIIADPERTQPVFDRVIAPRAEAGRRVIRFSGLGIRLKPGVHYDCTLCISLHGGCSVARDLVVMTEIMIEPP